MTTNPTTPIVCDMTGAPDTAEERMVEYGRLFSQALTGRERTGDGIRFRFRADDGVEAWVRDLAAREKACCPFFEFTISTTGHEVWWDADIADTGIETDIARTILDDFYSAPDTVADGVAGMKDRLSEQGLAVTTNASGTVMRVDRATADRIEGIENI
jgi:hypothetical protein